MTYGKHDRYIVIVSKPGHTGIPGTSRVTLKAKVSHPFWQTLLFFFYHMRMRHTNTPQYGINYYIKQKQKELYKVRFVRSKHWM